MVTHDPARRRDRRSRALPHGRADLARFRPALGRRGARSDEDARVMGRLVVRGLLTRKLRSVLTAIAIVLGVAMISGTFVLTDQISGAFDSIFQAANKGTDAVVKPDADVRLRERQRAGRAAVRPRGPASPACSGSPACAPPTARSPRTGSSCCTASSSSRRAAHRRSSPRSRRTSASASSSPGTSRRPSSAAPPFPISRSTRASRAASTSGSDRTCRSRRRRACTPRASRGSSSSRHRPAARAS